MDGWDISLLAAAGFFAVTMLARMMSQHGETTMQRLRQAFQTEQQRLIEQRRIKERAERKKRLREEKLKYQKELEEQKRRSKAA